MSSQDNFRTKVIGPGTISQGFETKTVQPDAESALEPNLLILQRMANVIESVRDGTDQEWVYHATAIAFADYEQSIKEQPSDTQSPGLTRLTAEAIAAASGEDYDLIDDEIMPQWQGIADAQLAHNIEEVKQILLGAAIKQQEAASKYYGGIISKAGNALTEKLEIGDDKATENELLREALASIDYAFGHVCEDFETCTHTGCRDSFSAWNVASEALVAIYGYEWLDKNRLALSVRQKKAADDTELRN